MQATTTICYLQSPLPARPPITPSAIPPHLTMPFTMDMHLLSILREFGFPTLPQVLNHSDTKACNARAGLSHITVVSLEQENFGMMFDHVSIHLSLASNFAHLPGTVPCIRSHRAPHDTAQPPARSRSAAATSGPGPSSQRRKPRAYSLRWLGIPGQPRRTLRSQPAPTPSASTMAPVCQADRVPGLQ